LRDTRRRLDRVKKPRIANLVDGEVELFQAICSNSRRCSLTIISDDNLFASLAYFAEILSSRIPRAQAAAHQLYDHCSNDLSESCRFR
jgi:hypothetical protein